MTQLLTAFPPVLPLKPRILILGSMPSQKSLEANQYYAHPQNQFWKFMGDIYGAYQTLPYAERLKILKDNNIALWDVVRSCIRPGSMDADIRNEETNDFEALYRQFPGIRRVIFNSLTAETIYRRHVLPGLTRELEYVRVPSPSPAHARMNYATKLGIWSAALKNP